MWMSGECTSLWITRHLHRCDSRSKTKSAQVAGARTDGFCVITFDVRSCQKNCVRRGCTNCWRTYHSRNFQLWKQFLMLDVTGIDRYHCHGTHPLRVTYQQRDTSEHGKYSWSPVINRYRETRGAQRQRNTPQSMPCHPFLVQIVRLVSALGQMRSTEGCVFEITWIYCFL